MASLTVVKDLDVFEDRVGDLRRSAGGRLLWPITFWLESCRLVRAA